MIKGVNKVVIEVNETGNKFFEKAILYVRPEYSGREKSLLESKAKVYISDMGSKEKNDYSCIFEKQRIRKRRLCLILFGYLAILAAVATLFIVFH